MMFKRLNLRLTVASNNDQGENPARPQAQDKTQEETSDDSTEIQSGLEPIAKRKRFKLDSSNEMSWELKQELVDYIHKYMKVHVSDKEIKDNVLYDSPVPSNIREVPQLDNYMKTILSDNSKFTTLKWEKTLKTIQDKVISVFGPLTKLWLLIDSEKENNQDDPALAECAEVFDQAILMLSQVFNNVAYHRRENVLSTLIDSSSKVKKILKVKSSDLNDSGNKFLFGEDFETQLLKDSKAIKKSQDVFTGLKQTKPKPTTTSGAGFKRPFSNGSLFQGRGRGQQPWRFPPFNTRGGKKFFPSSFKFSITKRLRNSSIFKGSLSSKNIISSKANSESACNRKTKDLSRKLEGSDTGPPNSAMCSGVPNTFFINTSSTNTSLPSKNDKGGEIFSRSGGSEPTDEGCYSRGSFVSESFPQQPFPCPKKE